ncbi:MAG: hypothetical protein COT73_01785 [Bdellovibrio sp. CG10_big_fil_rev_8_21_14_0_10_47_8]|nr:MAG: hypothetical protein COT73_01785 [Bdellovibrio sp. CG10_big_fil_rev_8_21_14_0_10_47_8]
MYCCRFSPRIIGLFCVVAGGFCASFSWAADAMIFEGVLGNAQITQYTPEDTTADFSGSSALFRLHVPLAQGATKVFSFTLSNQYIDATTSSTDSAGLSHFASEANLGAGFSFRWRILYLGTEYQQSSIRQISIGTSSSAKKEYTLTGPLYYGGLMYRMGALGIGVVYCYKKNLVSTDKMNLASDTYYEEKTVALSLSYHFSGTKGQFFKGLFSKKP